MRTLSAASLAFVLLLPCATLAEDLTGEAKFLNKRGAKKDKALIEFVREPAIAAPLPDPTVEPSALRIFTDGTGPTCPVILAPGRWRPSGDGFVYRFPSKKTPPGGVSKIVFKPGARGGKLKIKAEGRGYGRNAIAGPVAFVQVDFSVGTTTYTGRFRTETRGAKANSEQKVRFKGDGVSVAVNPGHELLEPAGNPIFVVWLTQDLSTAEYDALSSPAGWVRNQPREGVGQLGRFLRSPDAENDGEFTAQEMFGARWLHAASVVGFPGSLDEEGLLSGITVQKYHEITSCAGRPATFLTSPENDRYILVSRDTRRASETPTVPAGWSLDTVVLEEDLTVLLPLRTTVIRADNEDSFQGPLPSEGPLPSDVNP